MMSLSLIYLSWEVILPKHVFHVHPNLECIDDWWFTDMNRSKHVIYQEVYAFVLMITSTVSFLNHSTFYHFAPSSPHDAVIPPSSQYSLE